MCSLYSVLWPATCITKVSNKHGLVFVVLVRSWCLGKKRERSWIFLSLFEESWLLSSKGSETVCKCILLWSKASHLFLVTTGHHWYMKRIGLALCLSSICISVTSSRWFSRITCHWNWNYGNLNIDGKVSWHQGRISGQSRKESNFFVVSVYSQYIKTKLSSLLFLIPADTSNLRALRTEFLWV